MVKKIGWAGFRLGGAVISTLYSVVGGILTLSDIQGRMLGFKPLTAFVVGGLVAIAFFVILWVHQVLENKKLRSELADASHTPLGQLILTLKARKEDILAVTDNPSYGEGYAMGMVTDQQDLVIG